MAPTDVRWLLWIFIVFVIQIISSKANEDFAPLTEEEQNELHMMSHDLDSEKKNEMEETIENDNFNKSEAKDQINSSKSYSSSHFLGETYIAPFQKLLQDFRKTFTGEQDFVPNPDELHSNTTTTGNETTANNGTKKFVRVNCKNRSLTEYEVLQVKLCNNTELLDLISLTANGSNGNCLLVMFFAPWCHFSAAAAPHFNALARVFPGLHVAAIDAIKYSSLNTRFATIGIPNILLFHNGRAVVRFNHSERNLNNLVQFVLNVTELEVEGIPTVTEDDYQGPLPTVPSNEIDFLLWLSWACILLCCFRSLTNSSLWRNFLESIRNNWREAEAQHEHVD